MVSYILRFVLRTGRPKFMAKNRTVDSPFIITPVNITVLTTCTYFMATVPGIPGNRHIVLFN